MKRLAEYIEDGSRDREQERWTSSWEEELC